MPQATTPQTVTSEGIVNHSFGTFSWIVCLAVIIIVFCVMYLWVRRKGHAKQIDEKAGDEGED
jgi:tellurite resistance protein TehA-like permease